MANIDAFSKPPAAFSGISRGRRSHDKSRKHGYDADVLGADLNNGGFGTVITGAAFNTTVQLGATAALPDGVTIAFALALAFVAIAGRKPFPPGLSAGLFITSVSGSAILFFAANEGGSFWLGELGHVLSALTVLWYVCARVNARLAPASRTADIWAYASLLHGLAAIVFLLITVSGFFLGEASAAIDFMLLCISAILALIFRTGRWAPYPALALLFCLLTPIAPRRLVAAGVMHGSWGLAAVGFLCLASVIVIVLDDWRDRRRQWIKTPEIVPDNPIPPKLLLTGVLAVSICVGAGGLICLECGLTPIAVWLAALACYIVGHVLGCTISGEIGLVLTAEAIVSAAMAWITPGWPGAMLGLIVAGGFLVWLARFWDQQLDDGQAWTSAGRLIPIARRLGYTASMGAVAAACGAWASDFMAPVSAPWIIGFIALASLGAMSLLVRDGLIFNNHGLSAACGMALAAAIALSELIALLFQTEACLALGIALAALLLTLRTVAARADGGPMLTACVGGATPLVVLLALSRQGITYQGIIAVLITAAALFVGRHGFIRRGAVAVEEEKNTV